MANPLITQGENSLLLSFSSHCLNGSALWFKADYVKAAQCTLRDLLQAASDRHAPCVAFPATVEYCSACLQRLNSHFFPLGGLLAPVGPQFLSAAHQEYRDSSNLSDYMAIT